MKGLEGGADMGLYLNQTGVGGEKERDSVFEAGKVDKAPHTHCCNPAFRKCQPIIYILDTFMTLGCDSAESDN